jgi:hypothetical protein
MNIALKSTLFITIEQKVAKFCESEKGRKKEAHTCASKY